MTIHERKLQLINWISQLTEEKVIAEIESIAGNQGPEPAEILRFLDESSANLKNESRVHTSVRDLPK